MRFKKIGKKWKSRKVTQFASGIKANSQQEEREKPAGSYFQPLASVRWRNRIKRIDNYRVDKKKKKKKVDNHIMGPEGEKK